MAPPAADAAVGVAAGTYHWCSACRGNGGDGRALAWHWQLPKPPCSEVERNLAGCGTLGAGGMFGDDAIANDAEIIADEEIIVDEEDIFTDEEEIFTDEEEIFTDAEDAVDEGLAADDDSAQWEGEDSGTDDDVSMDDVAAPPPLPAEEELLLRLLAQQAAPLSAMGGLFQHSL